MPEEVAVRRRSIGRTFAEICGAPAGRRDAAARGALRVTGSDRVRFLDGMLTNDVASLSPGESCYALLLERKGHILFDLFAIALEEEILLDTAAGGAELRAALSKFVIADDVEIEDRSALWGALAVEGPGAGAVLERLGAPRPALGRVEAVTRGGASVYWWGGGELTPEGFRALGPRTALSGLLDAASLPELTDAQAETIRIEAFVPALGADFGERSFPQEARLHEAAVSTTKGCFLGQEIVTRIHSRGAVQRLLVQLRAEQPMAVGAEIEAEGRRVGVITSAARLPDGGGVALGSVRAARAEVGTELRVAGVAARVSYPPTI